MTAPTETSPEAGPAIPEETAPVAAAEPPAPPVEPAPSAALERRERPTGALAVSSGQTEWTQHQLAALAQAGVANAPLGDQLVLLHQAQRTGLDPFAKQIYMIGRNDWESGGKKWTIQTGIDGFRVIARRTADRRGETLEYEDTLWCGPDGRWVDVWLKQDPPAAAKVAVLRNGRRFSSVARFDSYAQRKKGGALTKQWQTMPDVMIAKCFSSDTEVLTERGFVRFADVGSARIAQVTPRGIELVHATPFAQPYDGPMVGVHGDMVDFSVTPNHDMVTTVGKVEAGVLLATATYRPKWRVPLTAPGREAEADISDTCLRLAGYFLADGSASHRQIRISVSRAKKIAALDTLALHDSMQTKRDAGRVSASARPVRTRSDKSTYVYSGSLLAGTGVDMQKGVDPDAVLRLSSRQVRVLLDAWVEFDGSVTAAGVRRLRTSRPEHVAAVDVLAAAAGYSVNVPRKRFSDLSDRPSFEITISEPKPQPIVKPWRDRPGIAEEPNADGWVWCVTVPSGQIIVRRNGFAMVCGNCAEALALRKAYPQDLSGIYTAEEMAQADNPPVDITSSTTVHPAAEQAPPPDAAAVAELVSAVEAAEPEALGDLWRDVAAKHKDGTLTDAGRDHLCRLILDRRALLGPVDERTLQRLHIVLGEHQITDREDKLIVIIRLSGRNDLASSKELTRQQALDVIAAVEQAGPDVDLLTGRTIPPGAGVVLNADGIPVDANGNELDEPYATTDEDNGE